MATVLIVDDDPAVLDVLADSLELDRHAVVRADSARAARSRLDEVDLVVLDVGLPDGSGLDLLRDIRAAGTLPVLLLTGRTSELDRVLGFHLGADDFVPKPFYPRELNGRVAALLRRAVPPPAVATADELVVGRLTLRLSRAEIESSLGRRSLTPVELALLEYLMRHPARVHSREHLLRSVWGSGPEHRDISTVSVHVRRLREKLELDPSRPEHLITAPGHGYRLEG